MLEYPPISVLFFEILYPPVYVSFFDIPFVAGRRLLQNL